MKTLTQLTSLPEMGKTSVLMYLSSNEVALEATIEAKSSIEKEVVYSESAMSRARSGRDDWRIFVKSSIISARFSSIRVREKHVLRRVIGLPGMMATAASENVHSSVESSENAEEGIDWG
jgi:hypothetical protein